MTFPTSSTLLPILKWQWIIRWIIDVSWFLLNSFMSLSKGKITKRACRERLSSSVLHDIYRIFISTKSINTLDVEFIAFAYSLFKQPITSFKILAGLLVWDDVFRFRHVSTKFDKLTFKILYLFDMFKNFIFKRFHSLVQKIFYTKDFYRRRLIYPQTNLNYWSTKL